MRRSRLRCLCPALAVLSALLAVVVFVQPRGSWSCGTSIRATSVKLEEALAEEATQDVDAPLPPPEEPSLLLGAGFGAVATGTTAVLGPMLVKSELGAPFREALTRMIAPLGESYAIPIITLGIPNWALHWSHGGNTGAFVLILASLGVTAGFSIRRRRLQKQVPELQAFKHSEIMFSVLVVMLFGSIGGLASMKFDQQPLFESPHAWAALLSVGLLLANSLLSSSFGSDVSCSRRELHAQLGSAWISSVVSTGVLGVSLGTSYECLVSIENDPYGASSSLASAADALTLP